MNEFNALLQLFLTAVMLSLLVLTFAWNAAYMMRRLLSMFGWNLDINPNVVTGGE
ncbi:MAG: hypothetical protein KDD89_00775 [Anaerolineales bacterium]|nr:hypothetical protein [Anaerolineales bacterium]